MRLKAMKKLFVLKSNPSNMPNPGKCEDCLEYPNHFLLHADLLNPAILKGKIINIIAKLDNGSHSANQLQGADEALAELFHSELERTKQEMKAEFVGELKAIKEKNFNENWDKTYDEDVENLIKKYE